MFPYFFLRWLHFFSVLLAGYTVFSISGLILTSKWANDYILPCFWHLHIHEHVCKSYAPFFSIPSANRFSLATKWDPRSAVPDVYAATSTFNI